MRHQFHALTTAALISIATPTLALAQRITVQQPVVRNFSVNTVVSVPDRGGATLGGVKGAGESRTSFGPFRPGTATGLFREHAGASAHVYVHDFEAMDRMLLERARGASRVPAGSRLDENAEHAWRSLLKRPVARGRLPAAGSSGGPSSSERRGHHRSRSGYGPTPRSLPGGRFADR